MFKNLNDAFHTAKKDRQVLSKFIIWESGVSKSQFYRIINGKEAPSPETKKRIAASFNIDIAEFDRLHSLSKLDRGAEQSTPNHKHTSRITILVLSLFVMSLGFLLVNKSSRANDPVQTESVANQDDHTIFIKDVTIPDGTQIPVNTTYVKTWRVKNTGTVVWKNRYLKRTTPADDLLCSSPAMVPIPETKPGETVDISVTFTTPHLPGSCRTDWKTSDDRGNLYFPDLHGLFSIVVVVED